MSPEPIRLTPIYPIIQAVSTEARLDGRQLDPNMEWSEYAIAEVLMDLDEQVYRVGAGYLVTTEVAEKLKSFISDHTTTRGEQ